MFSLIFVQFCVAIIQSHEFVVKSLIGDNTKMHQHKLRMEEANRTIGMIEVEQLQAEVADHFNMSESVISKL